MSSRALDLYLTSLDEHWRQIVCAIAVLTVSVAALDWYVVPYVALGTLYIVPMLLTGLLPRRWAIPFYALLCALLRESLSPFRWQAGYGTRLAMTSAAFMAAGFAISALVQSRREIVLHLNRLQEEIERRNAAHAESHAIIDAAPVAILTTDGAGNVLMANASAERLFQPRETILGCRIADYLPPVGAALNRRDTLRIELECTGKRVNGETFLAHVWLSKYRAVKAGRAAIVVWDSSEELRAQQKAGLDGTLTASRAVLAGMAHEVRNLATAAELAYGRLKFDPSLSGRDMELLGSLLSALGRVGAAAIASQEVDGACDLAVALQELKVIIEPMFEDLAEVVWPALDGLPRVRFEHHALLQVMLNLARNAQRAIIDCDERRLSIAVRTEGERVLVLFDDTGTGIAFPERLFQPFRTGSNSAGIGLYVAREMLRNAGGDLRCERDSPGACFAIELPVAVETYELA